MAIQNIKNAQIHSQLEKSKLKQHWYTGKKTDWQKKFNITKHPVNEDVKKQALSYAVDGNSNWYNYSGGNFGHA